MAVNDPGPATDGTGGDLDLTPRTGPGGPDMPAARRRRTAGRWAGVAVLAVVLGIGSLAVVRALNDATLFFLNADEATAQRADLADTRFRLQGLVVPGAVAPYPGGVSFTVTFNGTDVDVEHSGDPVELFDDDIPVVLEGRWSGAGESAVFVSDRMLVKHDENYVADNKDRLDEADTGGSPQAAGTPGSPGVAPVVGGTAPS